MNEDASFTKISRWSVYCCNLGGRNTTCAVHQRLNAAQPCQHWEHTNCRMNRQCWQVERFFEGKHTVRGQLMPGRSLMGSGKPMLNALLAVCLYLIFTVAVVTFLTTKFLLYSVPGTQLRHSSVSEQSSPNLCMVGSVQQLRHGTQMPGLHHQHGHNMAKTHMSQKPIPQLPLTSASACHGAAHHGEPRPLPENARGPGPSP